MKEESSVINYLGITVCCTDHKHSLKARELNLILLYMHKSGKIKVISLDLKGAYYLYCKSSLYLLSTINQG